MQLSVLGRVWAALVYSHNTPEAASDRSLISSHADQLSPLAAVHCGKSQHGLKQHGCSAAVLNYMRGWGWGVEVSVGTSAHSWTPPPTHTETAVTPAASTSTCTDGRLYVSAGFFFFFSVSFFLSRVGTRRLPAASKSSDTLPGS